MKLTNKVEIKFDHIDKCSGICDSDCTYGMLYDFGAAIMAYSIEKIQENQPKKEEDVCGEQKS